MSGFFIREIIGDYIEAKIADKAVGSDCVERMALYRAEARLDAVLEALFTDGQLCAASVAADEARKNDSPGDRP